MKGREIMAQERRALVRRLAKLDEAKRKLFHEEREVTKLVTEYGCRIGVRGYTKDMLRREARYG